MTITLFTIIKVVHLASLLLWVGVLFSLQVLLFRQHSWAKEPLFPVLRKLYTRIDHPLMLIALTTGGVLLYINGVDFKAGWFHAKMTGVLLLVMADLWVGRRIRRLQGFSFLAFLLFLLSLVMVLSSIYMMRKKEEEWYKKYFIDGCEALAPILIP